MNRFLHLAVSLVIMAVSILPLVVLVFLVNRQAPHGLKASTFYFLAVIFGVVLSIIAYGFVSDFRHQENGDASNVTLAFHSKAIGAPNNLVILLPGMVNSGQLVYEPLVEDFSQYGDVRIVNYPTEGFNAKLVCEKIVNKLRDSTYDGFVIVGMSLGTPLGIELMRLLRSSILPKMPLIKAFVSVSGFTTVAETITPAPPWLSKVFRDLPFANYYWGSLTRKFMSGGRLPTPEVGVSQAYIDKHIAFQRDFSYVGTAAEGRFLAALKQPEQGEFEGIPAILLYVDDDVLVRVSQAHTSLRAAFHSIESAKVGGIHANLVERPLEYMKVINAFMDRVLLGSSTIGH